MAPPSLPERWEPYPADAPPGVRLMVRRRILSPELRNYRDVVVALPPSYDAGSDRYPVVYMQDGQNLFDPATSYAGHWRLLDTLADLGARGVEAIVVGIANAGRHRLYEYSPFRDPHRGGGGGDRYLAFTAETLKPMIDTGFRTLAERRHTAIAGSSMGGLISLYALYRYADVFGSAAALSPSVWFARRAILPYIARHADLAVGRLYLDIGLDEPSGAVSDARALRDLLLDTGLILGRDLDYVEDEAGAHNEETWGRRVSRALPFVLGRGDESSDPLPG
ncbi:MAG: alpha/beta hydrolase [Gemmatimonadales bacterium]|nr:alpha/beta hydrolase [Gemmatimonadales bacterium]